MPDITNPQHPRPPYVVKVSNNEGMFHDCSLPFQVGTPVFQFTGTNDCRKYVPHEAGVFPYYIDPFTNEKKVVTIVYDEESKISKITKISDEE